MLRNHESDNMNVTNKVWFASLIDVGPDQDRSIIDKHLKKRNFVDGASSTKSTAVAPQAGTPGSSRGDEPVISTNAVTS